MARGKTWEINGGHARVRGSFEKLFLKWVLLAMEVDASQMSRPLVDGPSRCPLRCAQHLC